MALQVGQWAQSVFASVQHFMPQEATASFLAQHLWQAQPEKLRATQERTALRARSFRVFIRYGFGSPARALLRRAGDISIIMGISKMSMRGKFLAA